MAMIGRIARYSAAWRQQIDVGHCPESFTAHGEFLIPLHGYAILRNPFPGAEVYQEPDDDLEGSKRMKLRHRSTAAAAFAILLAALVGCTTATPYQPYRPESVGGVHGGYSEQRLAPDRYLVRFHGNELTSRDRVEGYMLYRAAELAVQNSFDSFQIVERHTEHDVETYVDRDPLYRPW